MSREPDNYFSDTTAPRLIGWVSKRGNIYTDYLEYAIAPSGKIYRMHADKREEIASVLGVPAGTVASRIAKAVAIMRKATGSDQDWEQKRSSSEGALRGR